jgi:hypothetical protein
MSYYRPTSLLTSFSDVHKKVMHNNNSSNNNNNNNNNTNSVALVHKRTIPTERPPLVGEVSANFFADRGCHVVSVAQ